jgi:hypothetical protein
MRNRSWSAYDNSIRRLADVRQAGKLVVQRAHHHGRSCPVVEFKPAIVANDKVVRDIEAIKKCPVGVLCQGLRLLGI